MARKSTEPLDKRDMILFAGDWDRLVEILAPHKIKPTVFIRHLIRKKINEIEARTAEQARPIPELQDDDLDLTDLAAESSNTGKSE